MKSLVLILVALVACLLAVEAQACDYGQLQLSQGYCAPQQVVVQQVAQPHYVQQFVAPQKVVVQRQFVHQPQRVIVQRQAVHSVAPQQVIVNQRRGLFGLRRQQVIIR